MDDVGQDRLRIRRARDLPFQKAGHHLDPGQRVLDLVSDSGRHLAKGREAVAKPLTLFKLLNTGQVLEEQRGSGHLAVVGEDARHAEADGRPGTLQPEFGAAGEVVQVEGRVQDRCELVICAKDVGEWASDVGRVWSYPENPVGRGVEDRDRAVAADRHRAVAHAEHEIAVEMLARRPHHVRGYIGLYDPAGRCDGHRTH